MSFAESRLERGNMAGPCELYAQPDMIRAEPIMEPAGVDPVLMEPISDLGQTDGEVSIVQAELDRVHFGQSHSH